MIVEKSTLICCLVPCSGSCQWFKFWVVGLIAKITGKNKVGFLSKVCRILVIAAYRWLCATEPKKTFFLTSNLTSDRY